MTRGRSSPLRRALLPAAIVALVVLFDAAGWLDAWELPLEDAILRTSPRPASGRFVAIAIDDASLERVGPWPWPRERLARLVERARELGARGVAIDLVLPDAREGDEALAAALAAGPSVLAATMRAGGGWLLPSRPLAARCRLAHAHLERDADGILRRIIGTKQAEGLALPALAAAAAELAGSTRPIPVGGVLRPSFRTPPRAIPIVSAADLLDDAAPAITGAVAILGATASGLGDQAPVPTTARGALDHGLEIQAAAAEAILAGDLVTDIPPLGSGLLALVFVAAAQLTTRPGGRTRLLAGSALTLAPFAVGVATLFGLGLEIPMLTLVSVTAVPIVASLFRTELTVFERAEVALGRLTEDVPRSTEARVELLSRLSEELARSRAEEGERRRSVVHELKNPVSSIRGLAQLLTNFDLDAEEAKRVSELVGAESLRLARMIDGLLALERIGLPAVRERARPTDLGAIVTKRVRVWERSSGRPIRLEAAPSTVVGIDELLEQAIDNLIGNAVKYTPPDSPITVRVRASAGEAIVEVEDRGPGVPEDERDAIFQRFRRGRAARDTEGMGLGLALVSEVAALHGGRVEVASPREGGARFRIRLPQAAPTRVDDPT